MNLRPILRSVPLVLAAFVISSCAGTDSTGPTQTTVGYTIVSGDAQTGAAGLALSQPLVVAARDEAGHPVSGKPVNFTIVAGNGQLAQTQVLTDGNGQASAAWTLGKTAGVAQAVEARVGSGSSAFIGRFSATAVAGAPAKLIMVGGDSQAVVTGFPVAALLAVRLLDQFNNPIGGHAVSFVVSAGGGNLSGGSATTNAAGDAAVAGWVLGDSAGTNHLTATAPGSGISGNPAVFTATALRPMLTLATEASSSAQSGVPFSQQPVVQVQDGLGHDVPLAGRTVTASLANGSGTLLGTTSVVTDSAGRATFTDLAVAGPVGSITLSFDAPGATGTSEAPQSVSAGPASVISAYQGNNQSAVTGFAVTTLPAVKLTDQQGNPIANHSVTFSVTSGGGSVSGATVTTDAQGIARVGSWTLGASAGANVLTAVAAGSGIGGNPVSFSATALQPVLVLVTAPSAAALSGLAFGQQPVVQVEDGQGNSVPLAGKLVTVSVTSGSGLPSGTATATTNSAGLATFSGLGIAGTVGTFALGFSAPGVTAASAGPISLSAGAPASLLLNAGGSQSAQAGTTLPQPPSVKITDASGNPIAGLGVTFQVTSGGGSITGASGTTDAAGIVAVGSWMLGPSSGNNVLTASSSAPELSGTQLAISATGVGNFWSAVASEPVGLRFSAYAIVNGKLFVAGGKDSALVVRNSMQVYDPQADSWITEAPMPTARVGGAGGYLNGLFYVAGGANNSGTQLATVEAYNPNTDTWYTRASLPVARSLAASSVVNGVLYLAGGGISGGQLADVDAYDVATNTWSSKAPLPAERNDAVGISLNGKFYVIGGQQGNTTDGAIQVYDPNTDSWSTGTPMPTPRFHVNAAVLNGKIYVAGGLLPGAVTTDVVEVYDPASDTWTTAASMLNGRAGGASGAINGQLYIAGGGISGVPAAYVSSYLP